MDELRQRLSLPGLDSGLRRNDGVDSARGGMGVRSKPMDKLRPETESAGLDSGYFG